MPALKELEKTDNKYVDRDIINVGSLLLSAMKKNKAEPWLVWLSGLSARL